MVMGSLRASVHISSTIRRSVISGITGLVYPREAKLRGRNEARYVCRLIRHRRVILAGQARAARPVRCRHSAFIFGLKSGDHQRLPIRADDLDAALGDTDRRSGASRGGFGEVGVENPDDAPSQRDGRAGCGLVPRTRWSISAAVWCAGSSIPSARVTGEA